MVRKILSVFAALAVLAGLGFGAASLASAGTSSSGLCATNGTRVVTYFPGACPAKSFPISFPAGTVIVAPSPLTVVAPAPVLAAGESAAVLVRDSGVVLTSTTVPLKWSGATPPTAKTISGYNVQKKQANQVAWTAVTPSAGIDTTDYVVATLAKNTAYDFEVQAIYAGGSTGPWSNALAVTTPTS